MLIPWAIDKLDEPSSNVRSLHQSTRTRATPRSHRNWSIPRSQNTRQTTGNFEHPTIKFTAGAARAPVPISCYATQLYPVTSTTYR